MFSQNNEEKKLDWMYKGPNSSVDREEYLLGRSVDKTLEQLNKEEKQKQTGASQLPKNHVEHECIPPSIRDYKKQQEAEQVDLSAKLQEDPLVAIKKREEETRRQFLQNPIQLKKLQKALKAQEALKQVRKPKKLKHSDDDLDRMIYEKLKVLKGNSSAVGVETKKKKSMKEKDIDTILMHKFNQLKDKLSDDDMRDILAGKLSDSDNSSEDSGDDKKSRKKESKKSKYYKEKDRKHERGKLSSSKVRSNQYDEKFNSEHGENKNVHKYYENAKKKVCEKELTEERNREQKYKRKSKSSDNPEYANKKYRQSSSSSEPEDKPKQSFGLIKSDGTKIPLHKKTHTYVEEKLKSFVNKSETKLTEKYKPKRLTEEEKEQKLREMMQNAAWRDKEREKNVKRYRESDSKESKQEDFDKEFLHKELLKSANNSSVESRIRSNINNIQRSKSDMNSHFSRRH